VILRVFFVSPFQVWREQIGQIGGLKLELSEPERRELAQMAMIRAEKRIELAAAIREFHWVSFTTTTKGPAQKKLMNDSYGRMLALMGQAGVPESFDKMASRFTRECSDLNTARCAGSKDGDEGGAMTAYFHGRMTAEDLALKLVEDSKEPQLPLIGGETSEA
jgi:hypothetical protein